MSTSLTSVLPSKYSLARTLSILLRFLEHNFRFTSQRFDIKQSAVACTDHDSWVTPSSKCSICLEKECFGFSTQYRHVHKSLDINSPRSLARSYGDEVGSAAFHKLQPGSKMMPTRPLCPRNMTKIVLYDLLLPSTLCTCWMHSATPRASCSIPDGLLHVMSLSFRTHRSRPQ
jgi:hypothetical protein